MIVTLIVVALLTQASLSALIFYPELPVDQ